MDTCAVCSLIVGDVLEAAHIRPKQFWGSDHPLNGLVLCATHHRAFDAGLFAIEPKTFGLEFRHHGPTAEDLAIQRKSLQHLTKNLIQMPLNGDGKSGFADAGGIGSAREITQPNGVAHPP